MSISLAFNLIYVVVVVDVCNLLSHAQNKNNLFHVTDALMIIVLAIGLIVVSGNIERMENVVAKSTSEKLERKREGKKEGLINRVENATWLMEHFNLDVVPQSAES